MLCTMLLVTLLYSASYGQNASCTFSVSPDTVHFFDIFGGTAEVQVKPSAPTCTFNARTEDSWITVSVRQEGSVGKVSVTVDGERNANIPRRKCVNRRRGSDDYPERSTAHRWRLIEIRRRNLERTGSSVNRMASHGRLYLERGKGEQRSHQKAAYRRSGCCAGRGEGTPCGKRGKARRRLRLLRMCSEQNIDQDRRRCIT